MKVSFFYMDDEEEAETLIREECHRDLLLPSDFMSGKLVIDRSI